MVILHYDGWGESEKSHKTLSVPGSKYIANRLLILAALAKGKSVIKNLPDNEDINLAVNELTSLSEITRKANGDLVVVGNGGVVSPQKKAFYTGDNGTFSRFLLSVLALGRDWVKISGSSQMSKRPMKALVSALGELGAVFKDLAFTLPLEVKGPLQGGVCRLPGNISSQYFSALLLVLPLLKRESEIHIEGELVSKSYIDLTIALMKEFGVFVEERGKVFKIKGDQTYKARELVIPPDPVSASYFMAWAGMAKRNLKIKQFQSAFIQNDSDFINDLKKMNLNYHLKDGDLLVLGEGFEPARGQKFSLDFKTKPDVVQTFLVFAASLNLHSITINNIAHLRFKETNRVENTVKELRKCGINVAAKKNSFVLKKSNDIEANILDSHFDHRMAMSLALLSVVTDFIAIEHEEAINKTFPSYFDYLKKLNFKVTFFRKKVVNILLIGYRGSGKTTIAKILAKKLNLKRMSSDEIFTQKNGPIENFVKENGWQEFRKQESAICRSLAEVEGAIIDLGAGVVEKKENLAYFKNSVIVYLAVSEEEIVRRLKKSYWRPSLNEEGNEGKKLDLTRETNEHYNRRLPLYYSGCDFKVNNGGKARTSRIIENIWQGLLGVN